MERAKSRCSRQAEKWRSDKRAICAQIDEREAANWQQTRPQENMKPAGAGSGKCRKNGDAAAYKKTYGKNTQSRNLEVPDRADSKSLALANENLTGKKLTQQLCGLGGGDVSRTMQPTDAEGF